MRICVIGSGGREHALADVLGRHHEVVVTPGNPGIPGSIPDDPESIDADLFVIGPEAPLVDGLADRLRAAGRLVFGPGADGARLEGSKAWMKEVVAAAGVPTARHGTFTDRDAAVAFLESLGAPWVIKTDGLAAGQGVPVTDPLDRAFTGERSYLTIGHHNQIREHYTISRGTKPESTTTIGDHNYVMTSGHIAHNATIGSHCTIASCALIAGYVTVEDRAFISGGVGIHQFSKIGRLAMIGGNIRVNLDAPPYFLYSEFNIAPRGLNLIGLRRAGFTVADIAPLKQAYRLLYRSGLKLADALARIEAELPGEHTQHLVNFIRSSKRGIAREGRPGDTLT